MSPASTTCSNRLWDLLAVSVMGEFYHFPVVFAPVSFEQDSCFLHVKSAKLLSAMELNTPQWHILVATDYTEAARYGIKAAADLVGAVDGRISVVAVEPYIEKTPAGIADPAGEATDEDLGRLRRWADAQMGTHPSSFVIKSGLPGIEISRFAEESEADLVVLVRKRRSKMSRVISGDTVDSVVRRSVVPCLLVPPEPVQLTGIVAALDGTKRGLAVLRQALELARVTDQPLTALTVEPRRANEPAALAAQNPSGRSLLLQKEVLEVVGGDAKVQLIIRRGDIVAEILEEMRDRPGSVLAVGYHRGGPPGLMEAGSSGRRLMQKSPGPVLTVPL
jgi:nucleotide-binding universal stress UspA family protein